MKSKHNSRIFCGITRRTQQGLGDEQVKLEENSKRKYAARATFSNASLLKLDEKKTIAYERVVLVQRSPRVLTNTTCSKRSQASRRMRLSLHSVNQLFGGAVAAARMRPRAHARTDCLTGCFAEKTSRRRPFGCC
eukprot:4182684-Pleurochrysis_carterae.AAC.4